jgi:hypothetical protein
MHWFGTRRSEVQILSPRPFYHPCVRPLTPQNQLLHAAFLLSTAFGLGRVGTQYTRATVSCIDKGPTVTTGGMAKTWRGAIHSTGLADAQFGFRYPYRINLTPAAKRAVSGHTLPE